ncbi:MAG: ATP-binding protein [Rhodothermaceae bacterium]|nr:ATP-binding protein [Rhodothermaceae bacterium]MXZ57247.1 ATP-binding protein [Rhodothermaceae bacterium]MYB90943.1 ATP-binding protein [Rhodothermaceae bacterium]MYD67818.1 ATP-binding protein [Rhodothermaceae bacterium]MYG45113.1 ATP-binding protein [Rhodothermaceae bacterium]
MRANQAENGPLAILDLSFVPSKAVCVVVAVLARMIIEAVQYHRKLKGYELLMVLVLDEAHTFVHRGLNSKTGSAPGQTCCRTFERISREGRKFGLGLVLASQRPSEISPTILSQCNTVLLHCFVNDRDQDLIKRLVPDRLGELLRELLSLTSRRVIMLGWGAPAPLMTEMRELLEAYRPHSSAPVFWDSG